MADRFDSGRKRKPCADHLWVPLERDPAAGTVTLGFSHGMWDRLKKRTHGKPVRLAPEVTKDGLLLLHIDAEGPLLVRKPVGRGWSHVTVEHKPWPDNDPSYAVIAFAEYNWERLYGRDKTLVVLFP